MPNDFDAALAEFQTMLVDLNGDGRPDAVVQRPQPPTQVQFGQPRNALVRGGAASGPQQSQGPNALTTGVRIPFGDGSETIPADLPGEVPPRRMFNDTRNYVEGIGRDLSSASPADLFWAGVGFATGGAGNEIPAAAAAARAIPRTIGPMVDNALSAARGLTESGARQNALTARMLKNTRQQEELTRLGGPRYVGSLTDELARARENAPASPELEEMIGKSRDQFMAGQIGQQRQKNALAADTLINAGARSREAAARALPPPRQGEPGRYVDPSAQFVPGARQQQFRSQRQAEDVIQGGPEARARLGRDQEIDDYIARVVGADPEARQNPTVIAQAAAFYARESGVPLSDVVASMTRRGYQMQNIPTYHYQGKDARGRWQKLEPYARSFIRETRRRGEGNE